MKNIYGELNALKSRITDEELFSSREYDDFMKKIIDTIELPRKVNFSGYYSKDDSTACTDGNIIQENYASPITLKLDTRKKKYISNLGLCVHEIGHVLFTDFPAWEKVNDAFLNSTGFRFYPEQVNNLPEAEPVLDYFRKNPILSKPAFQIFHDLNNILEDSYIENRDHEIFAGDFTRGLHINNAVVCKTYKDFANIVSMSRYTDGETGQDNLDPISVVHTCIHYSTIDGNTHTLEKGVFTSETEKYEPLWNEWLSVLNDIRPWLNLNIKSKDTKQRIEALDHVFIRLWPYYSMKLDDLKDQSSEQGDSQNQQSDGQSSENSSSGSNGKGNGKSGSSSTENTGGTEKSGSSESSRPENGNEEYSSSGSDKSEKGDEKSDSSGSEKLDKKSDSDASEDQNSEEQKKTDAEERKKQAENLINTLKEKNKNSPKGNTRPVTQDEIDNAVKNGKQAGCGMSIEDVADQLADAEFNDEMYKQFIENVCNQHQENLQWEYVFSKPEYSSNNSITAYLKEQGDAIAAPASRKLLNAIKQRKQDGKYSGYKTGRFAVKDYIHSEYRPDGRYFTRKREPDLPDVVFYMRIDHSGSMFGSKAREAAKAAIVLSKILDTGKIPYAIVGDNTYGFDTQMIVYKTFEERNFSYDKLASIPYNINGGNRDGAAIHFGMEKLKKREEKRKILISISDGLPCAPSYHPDLTPEDDTRAEIQECRKRGIQVIGICIDNFDAIRELYGASSLDMTDLTGLSTRLAGLVERIALR